MTDVQKPRPSRNWWTVYGGPLLIGVLSSAGLLSALLYEGPGSYFSWLALGAPIALTAWFYARRRKSGA